MLNLWKQNTKQMKVIPQELRLGNLILHELFGAVEVIAIYKNSYDVTRDGKTKEWFAGLGCKGIPLTEEWLLRAGFELYDYEPNEEGDEFPDFIYMSYKITPPEKLYYYTITNTPEDGGYFDFCIKVQFADYVMLSSIQHVHQLQNLYFALTGKELEFKL